MAIAITETFHCSGSFRSFEDRHLFLCLRYFKIQLIFFQTDWLLGLIVTILLRLKCLLVDTRCLVSEKNCEYFVYHSSMCTLIMSVVFRVSNFKHFVTSRMVFSFPLISFM